MTQTKRVLICDDDADMRGLIAKYLGIKAPGAEVLEVANGETLVAKAREGGFSLVITDYSMGGDINGVEAVRQIRAFDPATPLFVFSGDRIEHEAKAAGANGYVPKGAGLKLLEPIILQYLSPS